MARGFSLGRKVARTGANRKAVDATLRTLRERLGDEHVALVQACRSLADAIDADPDNASLWREYRGALEDLDSLTRAEDDAFESLYERLRAPMGDTSDKPAHARAKTRAHRS